MAATRFSGPAIIATRSVVPGPQGVQGATGPQGPTINPNPQTNANGSPYNLTTGSANIAALTIPSTGTWVISAYLQVNSNNSTYASGGTFTLSVSGIGTQTSPVPVMTSATGPVLNLNAGPTAVVESSGTVLDLAVTMSVGPSAGNALQVPTGGAVISAYRIF